MSQARIKRDRQVQNGDAKSNHKLHCAFDILKQTKKENPGHLLMIVVILYKLQISGKKLTEMRRRQSGRNVTPVTNSAWPDASAKGSPVMTL